jgi:hypothetical protein
MTNKAQQAQIDHIESMRTKYGFSSIAGEETFKVGEHSVEISYDNDHDLYEDFAEGMLGDMGLDFSNTNSYKTYGESAPINVPAFLHWQKVGDDSFEAEDVKGFKAFERQYHWSKIYMYIHSGTTINTTGFACEWDSGTAGIAFVLKNSFKVSGCMDVKPSHSAQKRDSLAQDLLKSWVKSLDDLMTGQVFGYSVSLNGEETDSCWGYQGDEGFTQACLDAISIIE